MAPTFRIVGEDVLFAHWPIDVAALEAVVPDPLTIDTFEGSGWISVLTHEVTEATLDALPVSPLPTFGEVEFRTYVRHEGDSGVYFFSCDTGQQLTSIVSDLVFALPYYPATVSFDRRNGQFIVRSRRKTSPQARFDVTYQPTGDASTAESGSLEEFLIERHTYFIEDDSDQADTAPGELVIGHVERDPWQIAPAEANIRVNTLFRSLDMEHPDERPRFHYSPRFESKLVDRERTAIR